MYTCPASERAAYHEAVWFSHHLFLGTKQDVDTIVDAMCKVMENIEELRGLEHPAGRRKDRAALIAKAKYMRAQKKVGFAVVGLGAIARGAVLPAFARSKKAKLVAVVSRDKNEAANVARKFRAPSYLHHRRLFKMSRES